MKLNSLRLRDLFLFSIPTIVSSIVEPFAGIVDTALVGRLDTKSLASLGLAVAILSTFTWLFNFIVQASTQAVANGQVLKNPSLLKQKIKVTLTTAFFVGLGSSVFLYVLKPSLFLFVGGKKELWESFSAYYDLRVSMHTIAVLALASLSIVRGLSALKVALILTMTATSLNIVSSYTLLYVFDFGLYGVALGTVGSYLFLLCGSLLFLMRDQRVGFFFWKEKTNVDNWLHFGKHSVSLFTRSFFLSGSFFMMTKIAGHLGVVNLAAHQIMLQLWLLIAFLLDGLALSGSLLGGKYYFTGFQKRTFLAFRGLTLISIYFGLTVMLFFYFGEGFIMGLFTSDMRVILVLKELWPLLFYFTLINCFAFVGDGFLFGLEAFSFVGKNMALGCFLTFMPLALLSYYRERLFYVWLGMGCLSLYRFATSFYYLRSKFRGHFNG